jgi:nicotinamidase-related amidase
VLAGISTSGDILSTTGMAADLDYEITILADCCADNDAEVHRVLMEKILPRRANVIDSKDFLSTLASSN